MRPGVLLPALAAVAALCVGLWFINPLAPFVVVASVLIQLPIIYGMTRGRLNTGYRERAEQNRRAYLRGGNAAAWLAAEEREAAGRGYAFWSAGTKAHSCVNRAEALAALGRPREAALLLAEAETLPMDEALKGRFAQVVEKIREEEKAGRGIVPGHRE